jgi:hypothetical protein
MGHGTDFVSRSGPEHRILLNTMGHGTESMTTAQKKHKNFIKKLAKIL